MDAGSVWSAARVRRRDREGPWRVGVRGRGSVVVPRIVVFFYREGRQRAGRGRTLEFDGALREDGVVVVEDLRLGLSPFRRLFLRGRVGEGAGPSSAAP